MIGSDQSRHSDDSLTDQEGELHEQIMIEFGLSAVSV